MSKDKKKNKNKSPLIFNKAEPISFIIQFLEDIYHEKILQPGRSKKGHLVVDYNKIMKYEPDLAEYVLDEPIESIAAFKNGIGTFIDINMNFTVRFKNLAKITNINVHEVRSEHLGKFITVEGRIKQRSSVKAQVTKATFECPQCAASIPIIQTDDRKFQEPKRCSCGRKGGFKLLNTEKLNVYTLVVEELAENIDSPQLERIRILCKGGLTNTVVERMMFQGARVQLTGILNEFAILMNGAKTAKIDWYIDANYIHVKDESFDKIKYSDEDVKEFKKLAKKENWLEILRESIFYDIYGHEEECEATILQMFGGVSVADDGSKVRGVSHILLIGEPGTAKSTILQIAKEFTPKCQFVSGPGVSGAGVTAAVVKDEMLNIYVCEAGPLVLCNNGTLMIDELDKMKDEYRTALHTPMEQLVVTIAKAGINATLPANTAILAAANPKFDAFSQFDSIYSQLNMPSTIVDRFDLIYPMHQKKKDKEHYKKIAKKILQKGRDNKKEVKYDRNFVRKYISYSKRINPKLTEEVEEYIAERYAEMQEAKERHENQGKDCPQISGRTVAAMKRLTQAVARSRFHEETTIDDCKIATNKIVSSLNRIGVSIDMPDNEIKTELLSVQKTLKNPDIQARMFKIIKEATKPGSDRETISDDEIKAILASDGVDDELRINDAYEKLKRRGDIMEPKRNEYKFLP